MNFTFGNTRTDLNFGGGSGEPVTFEVVHGVRFAAASASAFCVRGPRRPLSDNERDDREPGGRGEQSVRRREMTWRSPGKEVDPNERVQSTRR